jgi:hypothetical protein
MKGPIRASISVIAASVMLVACASKGPVNPTPVASAGADKQDDTAAEYQSLIDNANNQLICKRQAVTGSRIGSKVCLTRADMEAQREHAMEVMRDIRESAAIARPIPDRPTSMPPSSP